MELSDLTEKQLAFLIAATDELYTCVHEMKGLDTLEKELQLLADCAQEEIDCRNSTNEPDEDAYAYQASVPNI